MTAQHLYYLFQCFFIYAFLGWCTEVAFAAFKERRFVNRERFSITNGGIILICRSI